MNKVKNWLVIGIPDNWETALSQPVPLWGLKPRYQVEFQSMNIGDFLWFYATAPVAGVIGVGVVKDKYVDNVNLIWNEEKKLKEVIWPLRFRIHVLKVLPRDRWKTDKIKINDFHLFWQIGFQILRDKDAIELFQRVKSIFDVPTLDNLFVGTTIPQSLIKEKQHVYTSPLQEKLITSHHELQNQIAEIGKLQFYYTETEYSITLPGEKKNLDVVWKREIDGVPTFVFEVELAGSFEKAIERLKFAFQKWNSRPRIVVSQDSIKRIYNILTVSDRNFAQQVKIYEPTQITDLLNRKRELKTLEQNLNIY
ncbi:MAG: hypothetical protein AB7D02_03335 [Candidatus Paceibacterota bacterium]